METRIEFLNCRTFGHGWRLGPIVADPISKDFKILEGCHTMVAICQSCGTKRLDIVSPSGAVYERSYEYPEGYQTVGVGRVPRQDYRAETVRRRADVKAQRDLVADLEAFKF